MKYEIKMVFLLNIQKKKLFVAIWYVICERVFFTFLHIANNGYNEQK
jgi:cbb3-type cytochrome oxidase subunit 1